MITPVNDHLLIEPVVYEGFMLTDKEKYEEIGVVKALPREWLVASVRQVNVGDKVYFDAWLAAKFPSDDKDKPYWLVKWEDIRAVEYAES